MKYSQIKSLSKQLNTPPSQINLDDWLIMTEQESIDYITDQVKETCCYFTCSFLSSMTDFPETVFRSLNENDDSETCLKIIEKTCGLDHFVSKAIESDSMGHFISSYDGGMTELYDNNEECRYAYRIN